MLFDFRVSVKSPADHRSVLLRRFEFVSLRGEILIPQQVRPIRLLPFAAVKASPKDRSEYEQGRNQQNQNAVLERLETSRLRGRGALVTHGASLRGGVRRRRHRPRDGSTKPPSRAAIENRKSKIEN